MLLTASLLRLLDVTDLHGSQDRAHRFFEGRADPQIFAQFGSGRLVRRMDHPVPVEKKGGQQLLGLAQPCLDPPYKPNDLLGFANAAEINGVKLVLLNLLAQFRRQLDDPGHVLA